MFLVPIKLSSFIFSLYKKNDMLVRESSLIVEHLHGLEFEPLDYLSKN
jgi:hypothetical protein